MGWPFWAAHRLRGMRLVATDTDWSAGAGLELRVPIAMLLLLLTGRTGVALRRSRGASELGQAQPEVCGMWHGTTPVAD